MKRILFLGVFSCLGLWLGAVEFFELGPIHYSDSEPENEVSKLTDKVFRPIAGSYNDLEFLRSVLDDLNVPEESQVLVYSKTSEQKSRIFPRYPRALYFSDSTYVGYVPGGPLEVITHDPKLGLVFYEIQPERAPTDTQATNVGYEVTRKKSCLSCHVTTATRDVPGLFMRSVVTDERGEVDVKDASYLVDDETPLDQRWGGWYVTGNWSGNTHMGNDIHGKSKLEKLEDLKGKIEVNRYPKSTSDIAALMVLEHQCKVHSILVSAKLRYQRAMHLEIALGGTGECNEEGSSALRAARRSATEVVEALLFCNEADVGGDGIEGGEEFESVFTAMAKVAKSGRHLRQFRLYGRLFKYRCSYMIHSEAFRALPKGLKKLIYLNLYEILTLEKVPEKYEHLKTREKKTILEILKETTEISEYLDK